MRASSECEKRGMDAVDGGERCPKSRSKSRTRRGDRGADSCCGSSGCAEVRAAWSDNDSSVARIREPITGSPRVQRNLELSEPRRAPEHSRAPPPFFASGRRKEMSHGLGGMGGKRATEARREKRGRGGATRGRQGTSRLRCWFGGCTLGLGASERRASTPGAATRCEWGGGFGKRRRASAERARAARLGAGWATASLRRQLIGCEVLGSCERRGAPALSGRQLWRCRVWWSSERTDAPAASV